MDSRIEPLWKDIHYMDTDPPMGLDMGSPMSWRPASLAGSPMSWQPSSQYTSSILNSVFGDNRLRGDTRCGSQHAAIKHIKDQHGITTNSPATPPDERQFPSSYKCPRPKCGKIYKYANVLAYHINSGKCQSMNIGSISDPAPTLLAEEDQVFAEPVDLTGKVYRISQYPEHGGGYADIYAGNFDEGHKNTKVAIKVLRSHIYKNSDNDKLLKRLSREIRIWARFDHPNILPLLGTVVVLDSNFASMVCPWMDEGDLTGYLSRKKKILTPELRTEMCEDITDGLHYIHSKNVIHGDLTTANILVNHNGLVKLSDFGLSTMIADLRTESFRTSKTAGSARWAAPELIRTDDTVAQPTLSSDVYSLGSVIFHVMSGQLPYGGLSETQVILKVMTNNAPVKKKPKTLTESSWALIEQCWDPVPDHRPTAGQVGPLLALLQTPSF